MLLFLNARVLGLKVAQDALCHLHQQQAGAYHQKRQRYLRNTKNYVRVSNKARDLNNRSYFSGSPSTLRIVQNADVKDL
jgi:hypothetical protein